MLISEKFVFTPAMFPEGVGARHATLALVSQVAGEQPEGRPARTAAALAALGRPVVALVCDPRSWYLALWREGCASRGELFRSLVDPARWEALRKRQGASGGAEEGGRNSSLTPVPEHWGPQHVRLNWYGDSQNVAAFREWLLAVAGMRLMRPVVSTEYSRWPVGRSCGLMSFHYSQLFIHNPNELGSPPTNWRGLQALDKARGLLSHAVRAEEFATDFPAAMAALGVALPPELLEAAQREQGRTPALRREWARFYDEALLKMLSERERFIEAQLRYKLTPPKESTAEGASTERPRRSSAPAAPSPAAPLDPAEQARLARIAEVRRLQEERLAQRRAAGVLPARFKLKPLPAQAFVPAPAPAPSSGSRRPRLEDFDEDDE